MQDYKNAPSSELIRESRPKFLARDEALRSGFSGTAFPALNTPEAGDPAPVEGQHCFRTDTRRDYQFRGTGWIHHDGFPPQATVAALKGISAAEAVGADQIAVVLGYSAIGDCPPIWVKWNPNSSATADDFAVFRPSVGAAASGNGRWLRVDVDPSVTFTNSDATPSVKNGGFFITAGTPPAAITDFDDAYEGQFFAIQRGAVDQVIAHDATKIDLGAADITLTASNPRALFQNVAGVHRLLSFQAAALPGAASVADFGAVGDGVTDDYAAIQAAITAADVAGGEVYFPEANYIVSQPLVSSSFGVVLRGQTTVGTKLTATHSSGPVIRFKRSLCQVLDMTIDAAGARLSGDASDHGIQFMSDDTAGHATANCIVRNVRVLNQPGNGIHGVSALTIAHFDNVTAQDCGGHAFLIESGESLGRANVVNPGQLRLTHCRGLTCGGQIAIGSPADTVQAYRVVLDNCETIDCATSAPVRFTAHGIYVRANNCGLNEVAAGATSASATALCLFLAGENIFVQNVRVINCGANAILVHESGALNTRGVIIDGVRVIGSGTQNPLVTVTSGAASVEVYCYAPSNITSLVTAGVPGGVSLFNSVRTFADNFVLAGALPTLTFRDTDTGEESSISPGGNRLTIAVDSTNAISGSDLALTVDGADCMVLTSSAVTMPLPLTLDDGGNSANILTIKGSSLSLNLFEDDATANEGYSRLTATGDQLILQSRTDANGAGANGITLDRSGTTWNWASFRMEIRPNVDDLYDCGNISFRWDDVYATNATIQTSDAREKSPLAAIPNGVKRAVRRIIGGIGVFQWLSSIEKKGDDARLHVGVTAQDVQAAFEAEGEDAGRWGVFICSPIVESVDVEVQIKAKRPVMEEKVGLETVRDGDSFKLRKVTKLEPIVDFLPVLDESGAAVMIGEGKNQKPAMKGVARFVEYDDIKIVPEERPKLDENGEPLTRMGVRYEQLLLLALAVMAEDAANGQRRRKAGGDS